MAKEPDPIMKLPRTDYSDKPITESNKPKPEPRPTPQPKPNPQKKEK